MTKATKSRASAQQSALSTSARTIQRAQQVALETAAQYAKRFDIGSLIASARAEFVATLPSSYAGQRQDEYDDFVHNAAAAFEHAFAERVTMSQPGTADPAKRAANELRDASEVFRKANGLLGLVKYARDEGDFEKYDVGSLINVLIDMTNQHAKRTEEQAGAFANGPTSTGSQTKWPSTAAPQTSPAAKSGQMANDLNCMAGVFGWLTELAAAIVTIAEDEDERGMRLFQIERLAKCAKYLAADWQHIGECMAEKYKIAASPASERAALESAANGISRADIDSATVGVSRAADILSEDCQHESEHA